MAGKGPKIWRSGVILAPFYAFNVPLVCGASSAAAQETQVIDISPGHYVSTDLESPFEGSFISPTRINDKHVNFQTCGGNYIFVEVASVEETNGSCSATEIIGPLSMPAREFQERIGGTDLIGIDGESLGKIADAWINSRGELTGILTYGQSALFWPVSGNAIGWGDALGGPITMRYINDTAAGQAIDVGMELGYTMSEWTVTVENGAEWAGIENGISYPVAALHKIIETGSDFSIGASYGLESGLSESGHVLSKERLSATTFTLGVAMGF